MVSDTQLGELIAVKICHDLSGPIGAINNGTELLKESHDSIYAKSLELVEGSAKDAVARLLLYRQAYGTCNSEMNISSLEELTDNYFKSSKVEVLWPQKFSGSDKPPFIPGELGKLILFLILLTSRTLMFGGSIAIDPKQNGGKHSLIIKGEGKAVKMDKEVKNILTDKQHNEQISVKNVHAYIASKLLLNLDMELKIDLKDDSITINCKDYLSMSEENLPM